MTTLCMDCHCNSDYGGRKPECTCGCHKWEGKGMH